MNAAVFELQESGPSYFSQYGKAFQEKIGANRPGYSLPKRSKNISTYVLLIVSKMSSIPIVKKEFGAFIRECYLMKSSKTSNANSFVLKY